MATGFGCMVVGPAGSGKVSVANFINLANRVNIFDYIIVNTVSHTATVGRDSR